MPTIRPRAQLTAREAAGYLLGLDTSEDDVVSNLKLQKLLYYAQGIYLARYCRPMFDDAIEAWEHGPVCRQLYHELKTFGSGQVIVDDVLGDVPEDCGAVLRFVHRRWGQYSAWRLREMTHQEAPWKDNYREGLLHVTIPLDDLKRYFEPTLDPMEGFVEYPNFLDWLETGEGDPWETLSS